MSDQAPSSKGSPNDFLKHVIGKPVVVRLVSGIDYRGTLTGLDGHMNIALEETTEWSEGTQKSVYGDAFVRGNNGAFLVVFAFLHVPLYPFLSACPFMFSGDLCGTRMNGAALTGFLAKTPIA